MNVTTLNTGSSRIALRFWVLLLAKQHRERERHLCTSGPKSVCDVQGFWRERERVHKRKHQKVWGAGESGVARGPETEVVQGCQMVGESCQLLSVLCVWRERRGGVGVSVCWVCV
jgi:hypothetical protein